MRRCMSGLYEDRGCIWSQELVDDAVIWYHYFGRIYDRSLIFGRLKSSP